MCGQGEQGRGRAGPTDELDGPVQAPLVPEHGHRDRGQTEHVDHRGVGRERALRLVVGFGAPLQPGQTDGVGRSVASMILGIISVVGGFTFLLPPIVGVVLGHIGLKREPHGRGMAIAGLVMNYVSLALLLLAVVFLVILVIAGISLGDYTST